MTPRQKAAAAREADQQAWTAYQDAKREHGSKDPRSKKAQRAWTKAQDEHERAEHDADKE